MILFFSYITILNSKCVVIEKRGCMKHLVLVSVLIVGAFVVAGFSMTGLFAYETANLNGALYDAQANFLYSRMTKWMLPNGYVVDIPSEVNTIYAVSMSGTVLGVGSVKAGSLYDLEVSNYRQNFIIFIGDKNQVFVQPSGYLETKNLYYCTTYDGRLIHTRNGGMYLDIFCDALLNPATAGFGVSV